MKTFHISVPVLAVTGALLLSSGCASGPQLDRYPRREIDRPYTLPDGVSNWHIPTGFGHFRDDFDSYTIPPIPIPVVWETSLSDQWTLMGIPIPLALSHQLSYGDTGRTGLGLGMGFGYGSSTGFRLLPSLTFSYRRKVSDQLAIDFTPSITPDIPFREGQDFRWNAQLSSGPLFQMSDALALQPAASLRLARGTALSTSPYSRISDGSGEPDIALGLDLKATWSIGRQWDLRPSYSYWGLGSKNGVQAHFGLIDFVHFW